MKAFRRLCRNTSGAAGIEYGIIASLIAIAIVSATTAIGTDLTAKFGGVAAGLP